MAVAIAHVRGTAKMRVTSDDPVVFLVDDDADCRDSLVALLNSVGLQTKTFASIGELLDTKLPDVVSCLVLDVRLPGLSGLDFQAELAKTNNLIPIIFLTGYADVPMSVKAMKLGAVDFLTKPPRDQDLLDAVTVALQRDRTRREAARELADLRSLLQNLTPRVPAICLFIKPFATRPITSRSRGVRFWRRDLRSASSRAASRRVRSR